MKSHFRLILAATFGLAALVSCTDVPSPVDPAAAHSARGGTSGPTVARTDPTGSPRGLTLDVRVFGSGFDAGTTVRLGLDGSPSPNVTTNSTRFVSSKELVANVTISSGAEPSLYDVIVTTGGGKGGIGTEIFEIIGLEDLGALSTTLSPWAVGMALNTTAEPADVVVVGSSARGCCEHYYPFSWTAGTGMRALQADAGVTAAWPFGVSNNGIVVGVLANVPSRAFWALEGGTTNELPVLTGSVSSEANGITSNGSAIVGSNSILRPGSSDTTTHLVVWRNRTSAPDSIGPGTADGISDNLTIIGGSLYGVTVWTHDGTKWVASALPGPASRATGISRDGSRIVGYVATGTGNVALLWRRVGTGWERIELPAITTTTTKKRPFDSSPSYMAMGVNNAGVAVGVNGSSAVLWYPDGSSYRARLMPESNRFGGSWAQAINDNNQVTGRVKPASGGWHAVLWTLP
ncbi:MAG TPA: hypothetical protein VFZ56_11730 [Gemmatimonadaceae bacterium]